MPNTYTDYSATANQQSFSYSFPVLLAEHVAVEINGVTQTYNTDYTVDKTTSVVTLQLGGITSAGASSGDIVRIRRKSDPATDLVDFADGSRLSASRLDLAYQHNRYLNEEASEISDGAIGETTVGGTTFLNATNREIRNLATPTTDNSATTKRYVDEQQALSGVNMTAFGQDDYTGDGTTTAFTFINITPKVTDSKAFLVNIDGITQSPSSYTISDTGITFTTAPVSSSVITVVTLAGAAITAPVDGVTTELKTGNKIGVKNGGIDNAKLAGGITEDKLSGNIPQSKLSLDLIDDDTFTTTGVSATSLASSESIKAYVDGEITDNGITQTTGSAPYFGVRAWANYNGASDTLNASGNIASVTRNGTGLYTFTFATAMPDTNYAVSLSYSNEVNVRHGVGFINKPLSTTHFQVAHYDAAGSSRTTDKEFVFVSVMR